MIRWPRPDGKIKLRTASSSLASQLRTPLSRYTQSGIRKAAWQPTTSLSAASSREHSPASLHSNTGRRIIGKTASTRLDGKDRICPNYSTDAALPGVGSYELPSDNLASSSSVPALHSCSVQDTLAGPTERCFDDKFVQDGSALLSEDLTRLSAMSKGVGPWSRVSEVCSDIAHIYNLDTIAAGTGAEAFGAATLDRHGNPQGSNFDLARDDAFKGCHLLIGLFDQNSSLARDIRVMVLPELQKKGWVVHIASRVEDFTSVLNVKQFHVAWIVSSPKLVGDPQTFMREVRKFHELGRGLMIWGENRPYFAEANVVLHDMFGFKLTGDTPGEKELVRGENPEIPGRFCDHLVCTGILRLYEGATVCFPDHVPRGSGWSVYGTSTNKKPVLLAKEAQLADCDGAVMAGRVVVDCGYTKLLRPWWAMAGTARYVSNACAWLAWREHFP